GHGQRRGVPAGTAALPGGDRRDDRPRGHGRWRRWFLPGFEPGLRQAAHRPVLQRLLHLRRSRAARPHRPHPRVAALAHDLGRGGAGADLNRSFSAMARRRLLVIGNGMVGQRLLEKLAAARHDYAITVLCEEPRPAYDRVALTSFFNGKSAEDLSLVPAGFF